MTTADIYAKFNIIPLLQQHQLRVAGVGAILCENIQIKVDKQNIVKALLMHDLGNMVRIRMDMLEEGFKPKGKQYWQNVKYELIAKYGDQDHEATIAMLKEIGVNSKIIEYVDAINWGTIGLATSSSDMNVKILNYSDMRVSPMGATTVQNRLNDLKERHRINSENYFSELTQDCLLLEKQIFEQSTLRPQEITEDKISTYFDQFLALEI